LIDQILSEHSFERDSGGMSMNEAESLLSIRYLTETREPS